MTSSTCTHWLCLCSILLGLAAGFTSGCVPIDDLPGLPPPAGRSIGELEAAGPHVYYNSRATNGGHAVYSGDNVSTGQASRATVRLNAGGTITIDQNTDPEFIQEAWCILVRMLRGQVHAEGPGLCFETPHASGVINSEVNFTLTGSETIITVFNGSVDIRRPERVRVQRFEQARIVHGRVVSIRALPQNQVESVFRWIRRSPEHESSPLLRRCQQYGRTAVAQQSENELRQCGFSGGRWSRDYSGHYNWCLKAPIKAVEGETRARDLALKRDCRPESGQQEIRERCRAYAETAVSQQRDNLERQCGFTGGAWSLNGNGHYQWCLGASAAESERETLLRQKGLRSCMRRPVLRIE